MQFRIGHTKYKPVAAITDLSVMAKSKVKTPDYVYVYRSYGN